MGDFISCSRSTLRGHRLTVIGDVPPSFDPAYPRKTAGRSSAILLSTRVTAPTITGVYETVLYGSDVAALTSFYVDVLGLRAVDGPDALSAAFRMDDGGVLLLFDPALSGRPGRPVPSHGASGPAHIAFRVPRGDLDRWRELLDDRGVPIDREVEWKNGSRPLYVRDPAGNSVELTEDELWPM